METNNADSFKNTFEEVSVNEIVEKLRGLSKYLRGKWILFIFTFITGGLIGFGYFSAQTPKYIAECTFILEEKGSQSGGLAGLASQFGLDFGGGGSSSLFAGDNLLEIIPSRNIIEKVLLTKADSSAETLADIYLNFSGMKMSWAKKQVLQHFSFADVKDYHNMSLVQDSVLNIIYKNLVKDNLTVVWTRKKASLIKVSVISTNEKFSKYVTERIVEDAKLLYIDFKTNTAQANVNRLQIRADSILALLNAKSYENAQLQVMNANPAMKAVFVPTEIATRDKVVLGSIYTEVVKNLEASKIMLSQQTPVIQILDEPQFPLEKVKTSLIKALFTGMIVLPFMLIVWLTVIFLFKK